MDEQEKRDLVRRNYAAAIKNKSCCSGSCCCSSGSNEDPITSNNYTIQDLEKLSEDMIATSFGCGNPTAMIELKPGQVVLDLGSGAGLDVLLSAKRVGPTGKAYGLDMTEEMLEAARQNQKSHGIKNAEFLKGHIEEIPLSDQTLDIIISNCVINLSGAKDKVFAESFRVLKPGGIIAVADVIVNAKLPDHIKGDLTAWSGCISGALSEEEYSYLLSSAGFEGIEVRTLEKYDLSELKETGVLQTITSQEIEELDGKIVSAYIRAVKPR